MRSRWIIGIGLGYVALRVFGLFAFAPHNDEMLYADAAQQMAADWDHNKWLFQNGRLYGEYKQPLQYWADALSVDLWNDPLLGLRIWSLLLGLCGLFFLHRLTARLWSEAAAHVAAGLVVVSEFFFYFDSVALNESFLYGLGTAYLYFSFDFLDRRRWISGALSLLLLVAVLSIKGTGALWIGFAAVLPLLAVSIEPGQPGRPRLRRAGLMGLQVSGVAALGLWLHELVVPAEFAPVREANAHVSFVRSFGELFEWPIAGWGEALAFYGRDVLGPELGIFGIAAGVLVMVAAVLLFRSDRRLFTRFLLLLALWVISFVPVVLLAKVFFVRYFGVALYTLYLPLGVAVSVVFARVPPRPRAAVIGACVAALLGVKLSTSWIPLAEWEQTELSIRETPDPWARGSGIRELLDQVAALEPGILVADAQWGHPGTALKVNRARYPQLTFRLLSPVWMETPLERAREMRAENLYYVLDARYTGERPGVDAILRDPVLCANKRVIFKRYRGRLLEGSALVLCQAEL